MQHERKAETDSLCFRHRCTVGYERERESDGKRDREREIERESDRKTDKEREGEREKPMSNGCCWYVASRGRTIGERP